jgi:hypothetical protein
MGREALIRVAVGDQSAEVKALLESTELIFRAPLRRRFEIGSITDVVVHGGALRLRCGAEDVVLYLGERAAASWAKAITTPPPTLRDKLGLSVDAKAIIVGRIDDTVLAAAVDSAMTTDRADADMVIAVIHDPDDLREALAVLRAGAPVPVWAVYPKGRNVSFGDGPIRDLLRSEGLRDAKSCAVSERLTATRYNAPSG